MPLSGKKQTQEKIRAFIPNNAISMAKDNKVNIAVPVAVKRFMILALRPVL